MDTQNEIVDDDGGDSSPKPKRGRKKRDRTPREELAARVQETVELIAMMHPRDRIILVIRNKYKVSLAAANTYYDMAASAIKEHAADMGVGDDVIQRMRVQLAKIYQKAWADADWRTVLAVLKAEADLLGINAPKKQEVSNPHGQPISISLTESQLSQLTDEQLAKLESLIKLSQIHHESESKNE